MACNHVHLKSKGVGMKEKILFLTAGALAAAHVLAEPPPPQSSARRDQYRVMQAVQEIDRLGAQFSMLNENVDALAARVVRLENAPSADRELRDEIAALKAQLAAIENRQRTLKQEIVNEITAKVTALMAKQAAALTPPPPPPQPKPKGKTPPQITGNYYEVEIEPGYTLGAIAQTYKTTVKRILDANPGLKPTQLRVGQKIIVPVD